MFRKSSLYLILALFFLVGGMLYEYYRWWNPYGTVTLWFLWPLLPAGVFLLAYREARNAERPLRHWLLLPACGLIALVITAGVCGIEESTRETANPGLYRFILKHYCPKGENLTEHFPPAIPAEARMVRFSFQPKLLMGGTHIQLRCQLPAENIEQWYEAFSRQKTVSYYGGGMLTPVNQHKSGLATTFFYTSDRGREFPDDYELLVLDQPLCENDMRKRCNWNHARTHGVAISKKRNEIVYWADFW